MAVRRASSGRAFLPKPLLLATLVPALTELLDKHAPGRGAPHLGTNLVQTAAFLLAKIARREFSIDTCVRFGALDNAPHDVVLGPETHHAYQQTYVHALGKDGIGELIEGYYRSFFDSLSQATDTDYVVETYTDQQATPGFRAE